MQAIVGGLVAFAIVVGWVLLRWRARGRDPSYLDDPSILVAAPPDGMTAATATIVDGGPGPTAFMAALFDLASRDEIAFRDETPDAKGAHHVGIEIRGGHTDDARVMLNRRRPVGEGEAWLLANIKTFAAIDLGGSDGDQRAMAAMVAMAGISGFVADAMAERGGPLPGSPRGSDPKRALMMDLIHEAIDDPAAISADPQAFASRVEAVTGQAPTAEEMATLTTWLHARQAVEGDSRAQGAQGAYIAAARAVAFHPPLGFATFVENYARRQGWIVGLSFIARWKWRALAITEMVVGLVVAGLGSAEQALAYGVGLGVAAGGLVTWFVAPYMATRTHEGAVMKAELAAYRRTLKSTFETSATLDDAVTAAGMTWLETPDQALVWGVALGLRPEIEALLRRTTDAIGAGTVSTSAFLPRWIARAAGAVAAAASEPSPTSVAATSSTTPTTIATAGSRPAIRDYADVFTGIERIGTVAASRQGGR